MDGDNLKKEYEKAIKYLQNKESLMKYVEPEYYEVIEHEIIAARFRVDAIKQELEKRQKVAIQKQLPEKKLIKKLTDILSSEKKINNREENNNVCIRF